MPLKDSQPSAKVPAIPSLSEFTNGSGAGGDGLSRPKPTLWPTDASMIDVANTHKNLARFKMVRLRAEGIGANHPNFVTRAVRRGGAVAVGSRRLPLGTARVPLLSMTTRAIQSVEELSVLLTMRPSGTCRTP